MKRNIRHINLYSKFLKKSLKRFNTRESLKTASKTSKNVGHNKSSYW